MNHHKCIIKRLMLGTLYLASVSVLGLVSSTMLSSCSKTASPTSANRRVLFDNDWKFALNADSLPAYSISLDDSAWRSLSLPHDWAIEGEFSESNPSGVGGGALPGGVAWYRKHYFVPQSDSARCTYIDFDGVYMNASVYCNDSLLGTRPYGYASFSYDLTPYLHYGAVNLIAVRVDNAEQPNSRWYSGCGIYRNVWLRQLQPVHVAQWGTQVIARPDSAEQQAEVEVIASIENRYTAPVSISLRTTLLNAVGASVATASSQLTLGADTTVIYPMQFSITSPELWDVERPYLYTARTEVWKGDDLMDQYDTRFGVRDMEFRADSGFYLNHRPLKINGVCLHHDMGCLGAAVHRRAIERQLQIMQEMGCNAIRCSHNPPTPELLELCDSMGLLVMDETFDMWRKRKTTYDYARFFNEWHERDLRDLIVRDRNHPSIFIWSIGNEVLEQWTDAGADTLSLAEANLILNQGHGADQLVQSTDGPASFNSLLTQKLADEVRRLDPTRLVTAGCNEPNPGNHLFQGDALDVIGYNYHHEWFPMVPQNFPNRPFIVTESVSALMTRGVYKMPSDSVIICPDRWDIPYYDPSFTCSAYDNCHAPWSSTHEETLTCVKHEPFNSGQFIWTGFDYIGEPTPYGWPARSSFFGIVDLAGIPKDVYYLYQSEWRPDLQVLHLYPHWNWNDGQIVDLWAYYNNADEVELFVNGKSQGVRRKLTADEAQTADFKASTQTQGSTEFHVMWRVPYDPGTLRIVARKDGVEVAQQETHTAGQPAAVRLTPDRTQILADSKDLSYVLVEIVDADGNVCPTAVNDVEFEVSGTAEIAGVDNGDPTSHESFQAHHRKAMAGKCMVVLRNNGQSGTATLSATSKSLKSSSVTIESTGK